MKALILAGGKGSRIFPFDKYWQKAFMPVGNIPNALRLTEMVRQLGINDIDLLTGYKSECAAHALRNTSGVRIVDASGGLAETIKECCPPGEWALIIHGDIFITKQDLAKMTEIPSANAAVLLQGENAGFKKGEWICAKANEKTVEAFWGHPRGSYANARSCGVFLLGPKTLPYLTMSPPHFENVPSGGMPPEGFWVENCLQTAIGDGLSVAARYADSFFVDMDFPWDYLEANQYCCIHETETLPEAITPETQNRGNCDIGNDVLIKGSCIVGDGTVIRNKVIIGENCIIGRNCVIEDFCKIEANTVIGNNCKLGFTAQVSGVIMDRVAATHNCELFGVVGTSVDIGAGTTTATLRFDDAEASSVIQGKRHIHRFARTAFIGDYSRTGVNAILLPGARMGANCAIAPGAALNGELPHNTLLLLKQELITKEWGPKKYGWEENIQSTTP